MKEGKRIIVHFMHSPTYYYANLSAKLSNGDAQRAHRTHNMHVPTCNLCKL